MYSQPVDAMDAEAREPENGYPDVIGPARTVGSTGDGLTPTVPLTRATTARNPVAGRRRLRAALRRHREERRLTQQHVADAMEWSLSKLIRIESGSVGVSTTDLRALLAYYGVTEPTTVNGLMELARAGRRRPWWNEYRDRQLNSAEFVTLIGLEADATCLKIFNMNTLPGLLQTEAFARAALQTEEPRPTSDELEVRVRVRLRRQREVLYRDEPPLVHAVLDEAVLRRMPTDTVTARDQLRHLVTLADRPNIKIQIVPFTAGLYPPLASPFFILSFSSQTDLDVVYLESSMSEELIESPGRIEVYHIAFAAIRDMALSHEESIDFINRVAE
jgi:transcriptional regulator with XRE-family HTH domain